MNLLSQCTAGPYAVDPKALARIVAANGSTVATTGCDDAERDRWHANAQLLAHAYDAVLLLAAVSSGRCEMRRPFRTYDKLCLIVIDNTTVFWLNETDFGTPDLTPESRAALQRAIGVKQ